MYLYFLTFEMYQNHHKYFCIISYYITNHETVAETIENTDHCTGKCVVMQCLLGVWLSTMHCTKTIVKSNVLVLLNVIK